MAEEALKEQKIEEKAEELMEKEIEKEITEGSEEESEESSEEPTKENNESVEESSEEEKPEATETTRRPRFARKDPEELLKEHLSNWIPKTKLGRMVKDGKIKDIDEILDKGMAILEPEIVDSLIKVENDLLFVGQSKGKFGGGKRRAWRQAQKKTKEGNVVTFSAFAVVGDKNGHVGVGFGKAKETLPAREKALRKAKLNLIKVKRGSGSFDGSSPVPHSIPRKVEGKCGSVKITLLPAPQGTGLVIGDEGKRILKLAGIEDVYSKSKGHIRTTMNYAKAVMAALEELK